MTCYIPSIKTGTAASGDLRSSFLKNDLLIYLKIACLAIGLTTLPTGVIYGQGDQLQGTEDAILHAEGASYRLAYSGAYRDFTVPSEALGKYLHLEARGGDGGRVNFDNPDLQVGKGGQGASVLGIFKIGPGGKEIPPGATIRIISGGKGEGYTNSGKPFDDKHGAGGGGGTGILFLPPGLSPDNSTPSQWQLLMVAGGGGGGYAKWGSRIVDGLPGNDTESGSGYRPIEDSYYCFSYYAHQDAYQSHTGYGGDACGGGGIGHQINQDIFKTVPMSGFCKTFDQPIGNSLRTNFAGGYGGFQRVNNKMQPIGHEGGRYTEAGALGNKGGFGFGSGGGGYSSGMGGGGGYNGGYGGSRSDNERAGGGGSYVNTAYALTRTAIKTKHGTTATPQDGYVLYRFTDTDPVSLHRGFGYTTSQAHYLLNSDGFTLSWQGDGNLVLYNSGKAVWSSHTAGKGTGLYFQGDGNLVIRDNSGKSIWSSGTPDNWFGGKGGDRLQLSFYGSLAVIDVDGKVVKQLY